MRRDTTVARPATVPGDWFVDHGTDVEMRWDRVDTESYVTPNERFFVRNHTRTPGLDPTTYRLRVYGDGLRGAPDAAAAVTLSLDDLQELPATTITSALECTGNGRHFFGAQQGTPTPGTDWTLGAIGVAHWRGVALRDLLEPLGVLEAASDVMAVGLDDPYVYDGVDHGRVRRPIPITKALDDVLVAWEMNGAPLPADHGFPVRLIVPGWVGIASIKWLGELEVSTRPMTSPWNTTFYRMSGGDYPNDEPCLAEMPVKSAFELTWNHQLTAGRPFTVSGRSWSGAGAIASVEVSVDGGATWVEPRLVGPNERCTWVQWELDWTPPEPGRYELLARATDTRGRRQPDTVPFNRDGYLFWAVVRHPVRVVSPGT